MKLLFKLLAFSWAILAQDEIITVDEETVVSSDASATGID